MKWRGITGVVLLVSGILSGIYGCGKVTPPASPQIEKIDVTGGAMYASQCPYGSISGLEEVPLTLWACPINPRRIELVEPLRPMIFQADCKKKTLDVRSPTNAFGPMTWETMPDGNFSFNVDAG